MTNSESLLGIFLTDPWDTPDQPPSILPAHSAMKCQQTIQWWQEANKSAGFAPVQGSEIKSYYVQGNQHPCRITIEGSGQECLSHDLLYPTLTLWIHSIIRWIRPCNTNEAIPLNRPPVKGSLWWHDHEGNSTPLSDDAWLQDQRLLIVPQTGFVSYAPVLKTWVQSCVVSSEEWTFQSKWTLELQEWPPSHTPDSSDETGALLN